MSVWGSFLDRALSVYVEHLLLLRQPQKMSFYLIQVSKCGIVFTILISYHSTCFILVSTSYYTNKRKKCKRCILFGFLLFWDAIMMVLLLSIGKSVFTEQPFGFLNSVEEVALSFNGGKDSTVSSYICFLQYLIAYLSMLIFCLIDCFSANELGFCRSCCTYLGLAIFCIKGNKVIQMGF